MKNRVNGGNLETTWVDRQCVKILKKGFAYLKRRIGTILYQSLLLKKSSFRQVFFIKATFRISRHLLLTDLRFAQHRNDLTDKTPINFISTMNDYFGKCYQSRSRPIIQVILDILLKKNS